MRALRWVGLVSVVITLSSSRAGGEPCRGARSLAIPTSSFRLIERESGPVNYYRVVSGPEGEFVRSEYRPGYETAVVGHQVAEEQRAGASQLRWTWRARKLPRGGNECAPGKGDSAAVVYVTWKRGMRYYTIKYVWSSVGTPGAVCAKQRNLFMAQDTVILRSGGPLEAWKTEVIDLPAAFRKHFADGDAKASVPDFMGVALMSDGDQTKSESSADFGKFSLSLGPSC